MKVLLFLIFALGVYSISPLSFSKVIRSENKISPRVDGQYIVVFHPNVTSDKRNSHISALGNKVFANYEIHDSFFGYAAKLSDEDLESVNNAAEVHYIEEDKLMHAAQSCASQTGATWGINRISETTLSLTGTYKYTSTAGSGVNAYIVDTGILTTHTDFGGRAVVGKNYVSGETDQDCNGHGTHVAGTVAGTTYGVAKQANLIAVKVLGCSGSGTNSGVINGVNYVASDYASKKKPSVANMSLGGSKSTALNDAVAAAVKAGVTFSIAAGNDNADACNYSPASESTAISVGATSVASSSGKEIDARSSFSNYGTCVHILAPGSLITSDWIGSTNKATNTISGTSMAAPHVAGAVALYLGNNPTATPAAVKTYLVNNANDNYVTLNCGSVTACTKTPNKLVYAKC